jgi:hypothetical protein
MDQYTSVFDITSESKALKVELFALTKTNEILKDRIKQLVRAL